MLTQPCVLGVGAHLSCYLLQHHLCQQLLNYISTTPQMQQPLTHVLCSVKRFTMLNTEGSTSTVSLLRVY